MTPLETDDRLRVRLLETFERQIRAHGVDEKDHGVRGTFRNLIAVVLGDWTYERAELRKLREARAKLDQEVANARELPAGLQVAHIALETRKVLLELTRFYEGRE